MSYYAVTREAGPAWTDGGINEQPRLGDHAAFMNTLADDGVLLFAGPLAGTEQGHSACCSSSTPTAKPTSTTTSPTTHGETDSGSPASDHGTSSSAQNGSPPQRPPPPRPRDTYPDRQVWAPHERNDLETMKADARPFMPPRPADAPVEPDYPKPGMLEALATQTGLSPQTAFGIEWSLEYPDEETITRALAATARIAMLAGPEREPDFKQALIDGLAAHRQADGSYRLRNEFHYLIGRA